MIKTGDQSLCRWAFHGCLSEPVPHTPVERHVLVRLKLKLSTDDLNDDPLFVEDPESVLGRHAEGYPERHNPKSHRGEAEQPGRPVQLRRHHVFGTDQGMKRPLPDQDVEVAPLTRTAPLVASCGR